MSEPKGTAAESQIEVENKLFADFQENQPAKYWNDLQDRAKSLQTIRSVTIRPVLYLLFPGERRDEMAEKQKALEGVGLLTWEDLIADFSGKDLRLDAATEVFLQEFRTYIRARLAFLPQWERQYPHLHTWMPLGSQVQRELLWRIAGFTIFRRN